MSCCLDCGISVAALRVRCAACAAVSVGLPPPPKPRPRKRRASPQNRGPISLRDALALSEVESRLRFDELASLYEFLPEWQQAIVREVVERRTAEIRATKDAVDPSAPYVEPVELQELRAIVNIVGVRGLTTTERRAYWRLVQRKSSGVSHGTDRPGQGRKVHRSNWPRYLG